MKILKKIGPTTSPCCTLLVTVWEMMSEASIMLKYATFITLSSFTKAVGSSEIHSDRLRMICLLQNSHWLFMIIFVSFIYLEIDSRRMHPIVFPGTEVR